jgi:AcrR family transcriptional regulator
MSELLTTKERLLKAACGLFAEKGFGDATVADICEAAEANIAAVNYHFGDKERLYDAVWRHAFAMTSTAYPLDGNLPADPSVEDELYCYASAILHRIFTDDETGRFAKLLYHEMASPTLALDRIAAEVLFPQSEYLDKVIGMFAGEAIGDQALQICKHSIIGQCAFYNFSRPLRERVMGQKTMSETEIDHVARHIAKFSLGGLKEIQNGCSTD